MHGPHAYNYFEEFHTLQALLLILLHLSMAEGLECLIKHSRVKVTSNNTAPKRPSQENEPQLSIQNLLVHCHEASEVFHCHPLEQQMPVMTDLQDFLYTAMHGFLSTSELTSTKLIVLRP